MLLSLRVHDTARALATAPSGAGGGAVRRAPSGDGRRKKKAPAPALPPRKSRRQRGERASNADGADACGQYASDAAIAAACEDYLDEPKHLTCLEWCELRGVKEPGPLVSGHFRGWVEPKTRAELGIADDAASAWEQNGGGSGAADRKPSKGESAKEFARRMLLKNPNAFFYRHNKQNEDTWHGDWGEDEIENFVSVAKEHGCGDKWGLFASYVPHRVGYQCSAAYRHVIIPRGLLRDDNFLLTPSGETIWVGKRFGGGGGD